MAKRTRLRTNELKTYPLYVADFTIGAYSIISDYVFRDESNLSKYEIISDHVAEGRVDHECHHTKVLYVLDEFGNWDQPWYYPDSNIFIQGPSQIPSPNGAEGRPDYTREFSDFLHDSAKKFQQQFRSDVSIANFIYELKDFKSLLKRFGPGSGIASNITNMRRAARDETRERARNGVGGNFLDYTFNWRSLAKDLGDLGGLLSKMFARLEILVGMSHFSDHNKRTVRLEGESPEHGFREVTYLRHTDVMNVTSGYSWSLVLVPDWSENVMHANAYINNELQTSALSLWEVAADMLGLNNGPKVLWNATKLSWLVDFFLDTRDFFDAFEKQAISGHLGIEGGTASQKIRSQWHIELRSSNPDFPVKEVGSVLVTEYRREPLRVLSGGLFSVTQGLTTDQQQILLALTDSQLGASGRLLGSSGKVVNIWKEAKTRARMWYGRWRKDRHPGNH